MPTWFWFWGCLGQSPPPPTLEPAAIPIPVPAEPSDCLRDCLKQNMARATAPEIIAADCERACDTKRSDTPSLNAP